MILRYTCQGGDSFLFEVEKSLCGKCDEIISRRRGGGRWIGGLVIGKKGGFRCSGHERAERGGEWSLGTVDRGRRGAGPMKKRGIGE